MAKDKKNLEYFQYHWVERGGDEYYNLYLKRNWTDGEDQIDFIKKIKFKTILDYGCGCGTFLMKLLDKVKSVDVIGCDFSKSQIKKSKQILEKYKNVKLMLIDGSILPSGKFDVIFFRSVLMHVYSEELVIKLIKDAWEKTNLQLHIYEQATREGSDKYCFKYDYEEIFKQLNIPFEIKKEYPSGKKWYICVKN